MSLTQDYTPVATHAYPPADASDKLSDLKGEDMYTRNKGRSRLASLRSPRRFWPLVIIIGQGTLLIFGWAFFIATSLRPMPFDDLRAAILRDSVQAITMIATFFASLLSTITGYLFSHAIRYALTALLSSPHPTSLYVVFSCIRISQNSLIKNFVRWKWTLTGFICFFIFNWQTASWSTLLTPRRIELSNSVSGFELDMTSPDFINVFSREMRNGNIIPDLRANVITQVISSGISAVSSQLNMPTLFNFNSFAYVGSGTYGILPANYYSLPSAISNSRSGSYPVNTLIEQLQHSPPGYPRRYGMRQQGLTANVTCERQERNLFNVTVQSEPLTITNASSVSLIRVRFRCPNNTQESEWGPAMASANNDYFFSIPCFIVEREASKGEDPQGHWEIMNFGSGIYDRLGVSVCTLDTYITTLDVEYRQSEVFGNSAANTFFTPPPNYINASEPITTTEADVLSSYPVTALTRAIVIAQSSEGNVVANSLASFVANEDDTLDLAVLENYIRGVVEFSGTLLRAAFTVDDNKFFGDTSVIPQSMRSTTNGTFFVETLGWYQDVNVSPAVMISPTLIILASIFCVLYARMKAPREHDQPEVQAYFDAGDVLQVIAATANGDLHRAPLAPFNESAARTTNNIYVRLRSNVPGGDKIGLFTA